MALSRDARVGLTALAGFLCAGVLVLFLGRFRFSSAGYPLTATFGYVDSLRQDAPVLYGGGVRIGEVEALALADGRVAVKLRIRRGVRIPKDSVITIHTSGILGEKYVQVGAGDVAAGVLQAGDVVDGVDPGSLDRALQKVEALVGFLDPLLKDKRFKDGVSGVLRSIAGLTAELETLVKDTNADIRVSVKNLKEMTAGLKARSDEIKPVIESARGMVNEKNRKNLEESLASLQAITAKFDKVLTQIDSKKGTVGALVYDEETAENLRQLLKDLKQHPWKLLWKK